MKLWNKDVNSNQLFERFTIGQDPILDLELASFDVQGTIAHVRMLQSIGLLESSEAIQLVEGLDSIQNAIQAGQFEIEPGIEDCHSQIELTLTRELGEVGKKVHARRSRNDQVMTAICLYSKAKIEEVVHKVEALFELWQKRSEQGKNQLMPGYTHMQVAMPSSFGLWFGAYAEALVDDLQLLHSAYQFADKNPLGSAAGYGSSFPLDREMTTQEMNFSTLRYNSINAQMARGKVEKITAFGLANLASTLSKFSSDVCTYSGQNFGFFKHDENFTTGSSIMPHKRNPDGFELVRAKCNKLQSLPIEIASILTNLTTGYHRDYQLIKESYLLAFSTLINCLDVLLLMIPKMEINQDLINSPKYDLMFTVEEVNKLVNEGQTFRDAYHDVSDQIKPGDFKANRSISHTHVGSIGNLANDQIRKAFDKAVQSFPF